MGYCCEQLRNSPFAAANGTVFGRSPDLNDLTSTSRAHSRRDPLFDPRGSQGISSQIPGNLFSIIDADLGRPRPALSRTCSRTLACAGSILFEATCCATFM